MDKIRETLIQLVSQHSEDETRFFDEVDLLVKSEGDSVYPVLINLFTHLEFNNSEARELWDKLLKHHQEMNSTLDRPVKLLTAVCDYFLTIRKSFQNPTVVELKIFEEANHNSKCDPMTGLSNRSYFFDALSGEISRSKRQHSEFSLLFIDLDNFKSVNDTYGHLAGDSVLLRVSEMIRKEKRTEDTAARYGGEELVILLPGTSKVNALVKADRIRQKIEDQVFYHQDRTFQVTVSGGIASFPMDAHTAEEIIERADKAMYRAKAGGKNRIELFSQDKRQFMRLDFAGQVKVHPLVGNPEALPSPINGKSKDFSLAGMLFETEQPLELGTRIQLSVPLNNPKHPLSLTGTIVRVESLGSRYDIGISFIQVDRHHQAEINRFFGKAIHSSPSPRESLTNPT